MPHPSLIELTDHGLYCAAGDFYIDPWRPVDRAVLTHAHADHARSGSAWYLAQADSAGILRHRLGRDINLDTVAYGAPVTIGNATVSLHPAGHVLGSAQVRVQVDDAVWVASGDFKRDPDPTCAAFEPVACDTFITEATFALPVYRWPGIDTVIDDIRGWWSANAAAGATSVLLCYSLGKAQRVLAELARREDVAYRTVYLHGAVAPLVDVYRNAGVTMLPTARVSDVSKTDKLPGELVIAPPSAAGSTWMRRFADPRTGFASGWMRVRGARRRRGHDRGFVLSDHADWPSLLQTVEDTGARRVLITHGNPDALMRVLRDRGVDAAPLATPYGDETAEDTETAAS